MKKHKLKYNLLVMDDNEKILKDLQLLAEDLMFPFEFIYACDLDEVKKLLPDIFRSVNGVILDVIERWTPLIGQFRG